MPLSDNTAATLFIHWRYSLAATTGEDWAALAERETELFRTDMAALRILPPDSYVGATEAIDLIIELITRLEARDMVYPLDGDLYFTSRAADGFGSVSGLDRVDMLALFGERGGDPDRPGKRDPLDCLLWTAARPNEPSWDSPWGSGCSNMPRKKPTLMYFVKQLRSLQLTDSIVGASPAAPLEGIRLHEQVQTGEQERSAHGILASRSTSFPPIIFQP